MRKGDDYQHSDVLNKTLFNFVLMINPLCLQNFKYALYFAYLKYNFDEYNLDEFLNDYLFYFLVGLLLVLALIKQVSNNVDFCYCIVL